MASRLAASVALVLKTGRAWRVFLKAAFGLKIPCSLCTDFALAQDRGNICRHVLSQSRRGRCPLQRVWAVHGWSLLTVCTPYILEEPHQKAKGGCKLVYGAQLLTVAVAVLVACARRQRPLQLPYANKAAIQYSSNHCSSIRCRAPALHRAGRLLPLLLPLRFWPPSLGENAVSCCTRRKNCATAGLLRR